VLLVNIEYASPAEFVEDPTGWNEPELVSNVTSIPEPT
jgi:hypothetical protein